MDSIMVSVARYSWWEKKKKGKQLTRSVKCSEASWFILKFVQNFLFILSYICVCCKVLKKSYFPANFSYLIHTFTLTHTCPNIINSQEGNNLFTMLF